jgi:hypothetical protein
LFHQLSTQLNCPVQQFRRFLYITMASKHHILIPPWPTRLGDPSVTDLKSATPPALSSPDYVGKLEAALNPGETAKLKELDPNDTVSEARLLAHSSSTPPGFAGLLKDRENSTKHSSSSSDVPPETVLAADNDKDHPLELQSNPPVLPRGRMFRALTGGDVCVESVDVSGHFHAGHAPILKVRPAQFAVSTPQQHASHRGHREPISKLGPPMKEHFQFTPISHEPNVKHQPSNYWGFSSVPDKLDDVPLANGQASVDVITASEHVDVYSPSAVDDNNAADVVAAQTSRRSTREKEQTEPQDTQVRSINLEDQGSHDLLRPSGASRQDAKESESESWIDKRTSRWLKDLLHHPNTYLSRLTQFSDKTSGRRNTSPGNVIWGYHEDSSNARNLTRHSVDHRYKLTIDHLEHIISNAVELTKEATDHVESKSTKAHSGSSVGDNQDRATRSGLNGASHYKQSGVSNATLMVPIPQRMSSLLRLGDLLDRKV